MNDAAAPAGNGQGRLVQLLFYVAVLAGWYAVTRAGLVNPIVLPPLDKVLAAIPGVVASAQFGADLATTLFEVFCAFVLAAAAGLLVGYVVGRSPRRIAEYEPLLSAVYAVPLVLFFPLFVLFFGLGIASKVAIGAAIAFFPIVLNTIAGFANVNPVHLAAARLMGASPGQIMRHVMVPSALPVVTTGLRMGLIVALLGCLGTETIAATGGLGYRMVALAELMDTVEEYAYIVLIIVIAALLNALAGWAEARAHRLMGAH